MSQIFLYNKKYKTYIFYKLNKNIFKNFYEKGINFR